MRQHLILAAVVVSGAAGCAAPMALKPGATSLDMGDDGMVLFSTHVANTWKNYEVRAKSVAVQKKVSDEERARIAAANAALSPTENPVGDGGGIRLFEVSEQVGAGGVPGASWEQRLVVLKLPPGGWQLSHVNLAAGGFPVSGVGWAYVRAPFEVKKGTVTYLGRVAATRRERTKSDEPMAGPPIPLIDQAVTGFSGGTVDVKVMDASEADLAQARSLYPALQSVEIGRAIMVAGPSTP